MTYRFLPLQELYWGVVIAAALVLLQGLVTLDPEAIKDWQTWAIALGGAAIRAAAGAAIDYLRRSMAAAAAQRDVDAQKADELRQRLGWIMAFAVVAVLAGFCALPLAAPEPPPMTAIVITVTPESSPVTVYVTETPTATPVPEPILAPRPTWTATSTRVPPTATETPTPNVTPPVQRG
jgi:hypothetical protein